MGDADPAVFEVVMDIDDADAENDEQQVHYPWDVCIGECHVLALSGYDLPLSVFGNMTQEETDEAEEGDCCGCSATKVQHAHETACAASIHDSQRIPLLRETRTL